MINYPNINPIAISIGPLNIYWYGIMYLLGFGFAWFLANYKAKKTHIFSRTQINDLIFFCAVGVILGGRIGYVLFYDLTDFLNNPLFLFKIWQGGMAFHGGLIGVIIAIYCFAKKNKVAAPRLDISTSYTCKQCEQASDNAGNLKVKSISFFQVTDFICPFVPLGLMFGRIGNFINGELFGRITNVPWAMIFPSGGDLPRHPSMLYEALLEGLALFIFLWIYSAKPKKEMQVSAMFLIGYGSARILCEFFREPDIQIGFIAFNWVTMGQLLSLPMILAGILIYWRTKKTQK